MNKEKIKKWTRIGLKVLVLDVITVAGLLMNPTFGHMIIGACITLIMLGKIN